MDDMDYQNLNANKSGVYKVTQASKANESSPSDYLETSQYVFKPIIKRLDDEDACATNSWLISECVKFVEAHLVADECYITKIEYVIYAGQRWISFTFCVMRHVCRS